jgi:hypothetical protein
MVRKRKEPVIRPAGYYEEQERKRGLQRKPPNLWGKNTRHTVEAELRRWSRPAKEGTFLNSLIRSHTDLNLRLIGGNVSPLIP